MYIQWNCKWNTLQHKVKKMAVITCHILLLIYRSRVSWWKMARWMRSDMVVVCLSPLFANMAWTTAHDFLLAACSFLSMTHCGFVVCPRLPQGRCVVSSEMRTGAPGVPPVEIATRPWMRPVHRRMKSRPDLTSGRLRCARCAASWNHSELGDGDPVASMEAWCGVVSIATGGRSQGWDPTWRLVAWGQIGPGNGLGVASTHNTPRCKIAFPFSQQAGPG
jgi:hypothetical protein